MRRVLFNATTQCQLLTHSIHRRASTFEETYSAKYRKAFSSPGSTPQRLRRSLVDIFKNRSPDIRTGLKRKHTSLANIFVKRKSNDSKLSFIFRRKSETDTFKIKGSYDKIETHHTFKPIVDMIKNIVANKEDLDSKKCPLVKQESYSDSESASQSKLAAVVDFFYNLIRSTNADNEEGIDDKIDTLLEFIASNNNPKTVNEMTLLEFLIDEKADESLAFIDDSPMTVKSDDAVYEAFRRYYNDSDVRLDSSSDNKTRSDDSLTRADTVVEVHVTERPRKISESVIDLSNIKYEVNDIIDEAAAVYESKMNFEVNEFLEDLYKEALNKVNTDIQDPDCDLLSDGEDIENFLRYTNRFESIPNESKLDPLSDISEEHTSQLEKERLKDIQLLAQELVDDLNLQLDKYFDELKLKVVNKYNIKNSKHNKAKLDKKPSLCKIEYDKPRLKKGLSRDDSQSDIKIGLSKVAFLSKYNIKPKRVDACVGTDGMDPGLRVVEKMEGICRFLTRNKLDMIIEKKEAIQHSLDDAEEITQD